MIWGMMVRMRQIAVYGLIAVGVAAAVAGMALSQSRGDVLTLRDGTRVEGDVKREGDDWAVYGANGQKVTYKSGDVVGLEMGRATGATSLAENLASLRRSADSATDAGRMVDRYRTFIEMNKGSVIESDARGDLSMWEDRAAKGMVKIGNVWLEPGKAAEVRAGASESAKAAIVALRESRLMDAEQALNEAFAKDPSNPTALYVRGVIYYRSDKLADARKAFEAALVTAPGHGPTLGNLAVTLARMKLWMAAANQFNSALIVLPLERGMLNNVAEFLQLVPANQKNLPIMKQIERKFTEQDNILAQRLAQQGLFRWGATWVDQAQMDQIKKEEAEHKAQLDLLAGKFEQLVSRTGEIDSRLKQLDADIAAIEASTNRVGPNGEVIQLPLPQSYEVLVGERVKLKTERQQIGVDEDTIKSRARDLQKNPPNTFPKYTGLLQVYAAEAAPMPPAVAPRVTVPATQP